MAQRNPAGGPSPESMSASSGDAAAQGAQGRAEAPEPAATPEAFEQCLARLETLVEHLEDGELPLEEALAAFEEGVALMRHCAAQLDRAERRIDVLVKQGRDLVERPFGTGDEGD